MKISDFDIVEYRQQVKAAILTNNIPELAKLKDSFGKRRVLLETYADYSHYQHEESDYVILTPKLKEQIEIIYFNGCKNGNPPEIPQFVKVDFTQAEVIEILKHFDEEY